MLFSRRSHLQSEGSHHTQRSFAVSVVLSVLLLTALALVGHLQATRTQAHPQPIGPMSGVAVAPAALADLPAPESAVNFAPLQASVGVTISDAFVVEGDDAEVPRPMTFTVFLDTLPDGPVEVEFATQDGSGIAGSAYDETDGTIIIPAGQQTGEIVINTIGDDEYADGQIESFFVNLVSVTSSGGADTLTVNDNQGVGDIQDNDPPPTIFIADELILFEGDGDNTNTAINLQITNSSAFPITVTYELEIDSCTAGSQAVLGEDYDFDVIPGTITIDAGEVIKGIEVTIINDDRPELDEFFCLRFNNGGSARSNVAGDGIGVITIRENPTDLPVATFSATEYEVLEDAGEATITVTLNYPFFTDVQVGYFTDVVTSGTTATPDEDFEPRDLQGTPLEIPAGETSGSFTIDIEDDESPERLENVVLKLAPVLDGNVRIGTPLEAVLAIIDNDGLPTLSTSEVTLQEGAEGETTPGNFTISLDPFSFDPVTVEYALIDGTATSSGPLPDYQPISPTTGLVVFPPNVTEQQVDFEIIGNDLDQTDRIFTLTLSNPSNALLDPDSLETTTTIVDDDGPDISFTSEQYQVDEGAENAVIAVELSAESVQPVTVELFTFDGTASADDDFENVRGFELVFAPGETVQTALIPMIDDTIRETDETFLLELRDPINGELGELSDATVVIFDDESSPVISFSSDNYVVGEREGTTEVTLTARVNAIPEDPEEEITVEIETEDNTATAGSDYLSIPEDQQQLSFGTVTITDPLFFTPQIITRTVGITILSQLKPEPTETFTVTLSDARGSRLGAQSEATITILDFPPEGLIYLPLIAGPLPRVQFEQSSYVVDENIGTFTVTAVIDGPPRQQPAIVQYATIPGVAQEGSDYIGATGTLTFEVDITEPQSITLTISDDTATEPFEGFFVVLQSIEGYAELNLAESFAAVVIVDNDRQSARSTAAPRTVEPEAGAVGVTLLLGVGWLWLSSLALRRLRKHQKS